jgi:hypothetical protein
MTPMRALTGALQRRGKGVTVADGSQATLLPIGTVID